jgi:hypothetical protein
MSAACHHFLGRVASNTYQPPDPWLQSSIAITTSLSRVLGCAQRACGQRHRMRSRRAAQLL